MTRKPYPSDVSDDEWAFVAPYLTLMTEDAPQRDYALRDVFNGLRWMARTGAQWRMLPNDLPPLSCDPKTASMKCEPFPGAGMRSVADQSRQSHSVGSL